MECTIVLTFLKSGDMGKDVLQLFVDLLISPYFIVVVASIATALAIARKRHEEAFARICVGATYLLVALYPNSPDEVRKFLVRWSITLLLFVEVLSYFARKYFISQRKKKHDD